MVSRNRKQKSQRRRSQRSQRRSKKQGGAMLSGAPLAYSLAGDWSSKMSYGQGGDYLKYHAGQHGGALEGAPLSEIGGSGLPSALRGPAHIAGLDKAFSDIAGLKDQAGGRRRTRRSQKKKGGKRSSRRSQRKSQKSKGGKRRSQRKSQKSKGGKRRSHRRSRKQRKQRKSQGGAHLGYAPLGGASMLLDGAGYAKAGLTPEWNGGVEFDAAKARAAM